MKKLLGLFGSLGLVVAPTSSLAVSCNQFSVPVFDAKGDSSEQITKAWNFTSLKEVSLFDLLTIDVPTTNNLSESFNFNQYFLDQIIKLIAGRFDNSIEVENFLNTYNNFDNIEIMVTQTNVSDHTNDKSDVIYDSSDENSKYENLIRYANSFDGTSTSQKVYVSLINKSDVEKKTYIFKDLDIYLSRKPLISLNDFNRLIYNLSQQTSGKYILHICLPSQNYTKYDASKLSDSDISEIKNNYILNDFIKYSYLETVNDETKNTEKVWLKNLFVNTYVKATNPENGKPTYRLVNLKEILSTNPYIAALMDDIVKDFKFNSWNNTNIITDVIKDVGTSNPYFLFDKNLSN